MSQTARLLALAYLVLAVALAPGLEHSSVIRGTLKDQGPIMSAEIDLQSLEDEHCAKLFVAKRGDEKSLQELEHCMHDIASVGPDEMGNYHFSGLKPGWYDIHLVWSIQNKPDHPLTIYKAGDWVVLYNGGKDRTGKYDTMAQSLPFYFSGKEDVVKDFVNRR